ncbi:unnamed protein product [Phytophthora lilii]|uniref:Unnamed protein product n=1 Tax=Phytophthora lilii TaxID=2077276 RepID=A0A9W6TJX4_9STRA|nr:unnamed protein product [Phytophthora lilii]
MGSGSDFEDVGTSSMRSSSSAAPAIGARLGEAPVAEPEPSAEPEAPPALDNVLPMQGSPEKKSQAEPSGGASALPSVRVDEGLSRGQPAESQALALRGASEAMTTSSQPLSAHPKPTAMDLSGSQVEGGALSVLGKLENTTEVVRYSWGWDGPGPVELRAWCESIRTWERCLVNVAEADAARCVRCFTSDLIGVQEIRIKAEIEQIAHFVGLGLIAWKEAVGSTPCYVRPAAELQLMALTAQTSETQLGFPGSGGGIPLIDEDTELYLGHDVIMRIQWAGLRSRSSVSCVDEEPSRKRPWLARSQPDDSTQGYHGPSYEVPQRDESLPSASGSTTRSDVSMMMIGPISLHEVSLYLAATARTSFPGMTIINLSEPCQTSFNSAQGGSLELSVQVIGTQSITDTNARSPSSTELPHKRYSKPVASTLDVNPNIVFRFPSKQIQLQTVLASGISISR